MIGGPRSTKLVSLDQDQQSYEELVGKFNGISTKAAVEEIKALMTATLPHRNLLRSTNELSILKIYNKFKECNFLVSLNI